MSDFSIVWLKQEKGPCILCGDDTGVGAVGWRHKGDQVGPVCDGCMLDRDKTLGDVLRLAKVLDDLPVN